MEYKTAYPDRYEVLRAFARENRKQMTLAESVLWDALRRGSLSDHKFLRQHVIGDFIVDFLCRDDGLILEVDGGYHSEPQQIVSDVERDEWLEQQGYTVMRFSNDEVLNNIDNVLMTIERFFE
jgi:very-short-patch-repair endonuclease